jgi:hypothetical protein
VLTILRRSVYTLEEIAVVGFNEHLCNLSNGSRLSSVVEEIPMKDGIA